MYSQPLVDAIAEAEGLVAAAPLAAELRAIWRAEIAPACGERPGRACQLLRRASVCWTTARAAGHVSQIRVGSRCRLATCHHWPRVTTGTHRALI